MNIKKLLSIGMLAFTVILCGAWDDSCNEDMTPQSVKQQNAQQEQLAQQSNAQTGMPGVTNFTEKKITKKLYELRDQQIVTYSYTMDINGNLHHICDSIGYGLPYGVQYSNPDRPVEGRTQGEFIALPQPEPNGLYMPPTAEGTWVICAGEKAGDIRPIYVEPRVIVSPFKLHAVSEYQEK